MSEARTATGELRGPAGPKERLVWPDLAKGACIVLVVLWHVIMKHYLQVGWHPALPFPGAWGIAGEMLLPLRMPLFFAISGFFAAGALSRSWSVIGRTKVANFYYLYVLWLLIHTPLLALVPDFDTARATGFGDLLLELTVTPTNLWYLYALGAYFVIAKLVSRVPPPIVLAGAFLLSAASSAELLAAPGDRGGVYENLLFFLVGVYGKPLITRMAASATWLRFFAVAVPYLGLLAVIQLFGAETWFGLWPATCFVALFLGATLASLATRWTALSDVLVDIGGKTLPIYVVHMPLLALIHAVLVGPLSSLHPLAQSALAVVEPILLTAAVVGICLILYRILPSAWIFDLPWSRKRATTRAPAKAGDPT